VGTAKEFTETEELLQAGHKRFIELASKTSSGAPRKGTRFRSSHCEGLIQYARAAQSAPPANATGEDPWLQQDEIELDQQLVEGARLTVLVNAYERNAVARTRCLAFYGASCTACGFTFEEIYGTDTMNYIHVHHRKPLATIGEKYVIDPIADLRPVCANCHAVIHLRNPPYSIEAVQRMLMGTHDNPSRGA
jgi:predicted HNH restriction endonuclease